ncbi:hypothetical protein BCR33DRAFT_306321 [Rhizoclosmatium globosum]|uniref:ARM repeat-containing protein n=1 Tax=Rhizoclosmatium globosum TaxID=329046 RepID=A0A1Y2C5C0_9FUNG|nr:hypothetical protein BCR33DRAFT_306321 [Rhizoclosmatium globosum]|eukprot:ORY42229.1 hypothetical protein BCR33DRAFT_306321 [Rhizoclosmatium globosum]
MPSAIWKPGRKLGLLRGLGMSILVSLLDPTATTQKSEFLGYVPKAVVDLLVATEGGQYLPITVACLDEEDVETRLTAVKALKFLLDGGADAGVSFIAQNFKTIYPDLIKRLDDASDSVRIAASGGIVSLANVIQFWYTQHPAEQDGQNGMLVDGVYVETRLDSVHWVEMIKGILAKVYLDLHNIPVFPIQHWPSFHYDWQTILPVAPATVSTLFQSLEAISKTELGGDYMFHILNVMFKRYTHVNLSFCPNMNVCLTSLTLAFVIRLNGL